jgi:hypothetical protein
VTRRWHETTIITPADASNNRAHLKHVVFTTSVKVEEASSPSRGPRAKPGRVLLSRPPLPPTPPRLTRLLRRRRRRPPSWRRPPLPPRLAPPRRQVYRQRERERRGIEEEKGRDTQPNMWGPRGSHADLAAT